MSEFIKKFGVPFTQISNTVLNDPLLSLKAKGLYGYLFSKPDGWIFHNAVILREIKEGRDAFRGAVYELEQAGYIRRHTLKDDAGKVYGVEYEFLTPPVSGKPPEVKPRAENQIEGKPTSGQPATENQSDINKQLRNTELRNTDKTYHTLFIHDGMTLDRSDQYTAALNIQTEEEAEEFKQWLIQTRRGEVIHTVSLIRLYIDFKKAVD